MLSPPGGQKEAFSRVVIDAQLDDVGWNLTDGQSVRYEYQLPDGTFADYVLSDRHGRAIAVVEAKRAAVNLQEAAAQGQAYAEQLDDVARGISSHVLPSNIRPLCFFARFFPSAPQPPHCLKKKATFCCSH